MFLADLLICLLVEINGYKKYQLSLSYILLSYNLLIKKSRKTRFIPPDFSLIFLLCLFIDQQVVIKR